MLEGTLPVFFFFLTFYFVLGYSHLANNVEVVSGEQQSDSAIHTRVSILPQTPLPIRLPHDIELNSMCCPVKSTWFIILLFLPHVCTSSDFFLNLPTSGYKLFLYIHSCFHCFQCYKSLVLLVVFQIMGLLPICCHNPNSTPLAQSLINYILLPSS